jgi:uncharacterized membrane protein
MAVVRLPTHEAFLSQRSQLWSIQNFAEMALSSSMRTHEFLSKLDSDRIVQAIRAAEEKTSGEIRVYVQRGHLQADALAAAQKQFHKLGMQKTNERNGVLIFVAPRARKFAVIGDAGVHQKCGEEYWQRLVDSMGEHFQSENFDRALLEAIEQTGELLATHFPKHDGGANELPDEIIGN